MLEIRNYIAVYDSWKERKSKHPLSAGTAPAGPENFQGQMG